MKSYELLIRRRMDEHAAMFTGLRAQVSIINEIAESMLAAYHQGNKSLFFGNGGSASDAQHIAAELVGRYRMDRKPVAALALTTNAALLTAVSNDYGYNDVFSRQIEAQGEPGDIAVGISTSGHSENVLRGLQVAKDKGLVTVGLTGPNGGRMYELVDHCLCVPGQETARVQEGHIFVGHMLCEIIEAVLFSQ